MLNQLLRLERPFAILDCETTGLNPDKDRIVQLAITVHYAHRDPIEWSTLLNPEMPIPNSSIHGITDAMVEGMPTFQMLAPELAPKLLTVDIGGHNVEYDLKFLRAEMIRAGITWAWNGHVVDTLQICRKMIPHTLTNAYKHYVDANGFDNAHQAHADVWATGEVLCGQLRAHKELPRTVAELSEFCFKMKDGIDKSGKFVWVNGEACINFGKWRGTPLSRIDKSYLVWMINSANFPDDAIIIAGNALKGIYPTKE